MEIGVDGVLKPVRVALIPEMPLDLLLGVNDFIHTHSEATPVISGNQNLMVLTRSQKRRQAVTRHTTLATTTTTSPSSLTPHMPAVIVQADAERETTESQPAIEAASELVESNSIQADPRNKIEADGPGNTYK